MCSIPQFAAGSSSSLELVDLTPAPERDDASVRTMVRDGRHDASSTIRILPQNPIDQHERPAPRFAGVCRVVVAWLPGAAQHSPCA